MHTPEDYILNAVEAVSAWWDLPDDEAFINAVNDQARLMAGGLDSYEDNTITDSH
jgi:hypothetical protein